MITGSPLTRNAHPMMSRIVDRSGRRFIRRHPHCGDMPTTTPPVAGGRRWIGRNRPVIADLLNAPTEPMASSMRLSIIG